MVKKGKLVLFSTLFFSTLQPVQANVGIGIGVVATSGIYRDYDNQTIPIPLINYDSETFYLRGLQAGYYLIKEKQDQLAINLEYLMFSFKPSKTDNWQMKQLDKRKSTAMLGMNYRYLDDNWGGIKATLSADILNKSNGIVSDLAYFYAFNIGSLRLIPAVGTLWASKKHNNYYFGVSQAESLRSGLPAYRAKSGWSPYFEGSTHYTITQNWRASLSLRYTLLSRAVKKSPMVDSKHNTSLFSSLTYYF